MVKIKTIKIKVRRSLGAPDTAPHLQRAAVTAIMSMVRTRGTVSSRRHAPGSTGSLPKHEVPASLVEQNTVYKTFFQA